MYPTAWMYSATSLLWSPRTFAPANFRRHPEDDYKAASSHFVRSARKILELRGGGNSPPVFLRDTLAPLLVPDEELREDVFGPEGSQTGPPSASSSLPRSPRVIAGRHQLLASGGRSQTDTCAGCIVSDTTERSSRPSASRSTCSRS